MVLDSKQSTLESFSPASVPQPPTFPTVRKQYYASCVFSHRHMIYLYVQRTKGVKCLRVKLYLTCLPLLEPAKYIHSTKPSLTLSCREADQPFLWVTAVSHGITIACSWLQVCITSYPQWNPSEQGVLPTPLCIPLLSQEQILHEFLLNDYQKFGWRLKKVSK